MRIWSRLGWNFFLLTSLSLAPFSFSMIVYDPTEVAKTVQVINGLKEEYDTLQKQYQQMQQRHYWSFHQCAYQKYVQRGRSPHPH